MRYRLAKKEYSDKRACPAKPKRSGGFALLFSVLVSSLLLTIGLSIFSIALKELAISTATRQSVHAFYAADSGREYVKYLDTKKGMASSFDSTIPANKIMSYTKTDYIPGPTLNEKMAVDSNNSTGPNFSVEITKKWFNDSFSKIDTTITSYGHDTDSGDKVERAIFQTY